MMPRLVPLMIDGHLAEDGYTTLSLVLLFVWLVFRRRVP